MLGGAVLQHSPAELDHGLACECPLRDVACETAPVLQLSSLQLPHGRATDVVRDIVDPKKTEHRGGLELVS